MYSSKVFFLKLAFSADAYQCFASSYQLSRYAEYLTRQALRNSTLNPIQIIQLPRENFRFGEIQDSSV